MSGFQVRKDYSRSFEGDERRLPVPIRYSRYVYHARLYHCRLYLKILLFLRRESAVLQLPAKPRQ